MSTISDDCCCLLSIMRRKQKSRRVSLSEDSLILPHPARRTAGQRPRCCLVTRRRQQAAQGVANWISSQEAIELKCYSLSKDRVVVSLDKRCCLLSPSNGLTRTRPLSCMEDGRRHLDTRRRPDSVSLIKLCLDPESGQLKRSLSIHEIDSDNEFEALVTEQQIRTNAAETKTPLDHEALVKQLSRRSLVIVERNSLAKMSSSLVLDLPETGNDSEPAADSLEHDFAESLSLGPGENSDFLCQSHTQHEQEQEHEESYEHVHVHDCDEQQQQVVNDKKLDTFKPAAPQGRKTRRRKPLKFVAKRLAQWMGNAGAGSETASERDDTPTPTPKDLSAPETTSDSYSCERQQATDCRDCHTRENHGQLVAMGRPESIFLWPQRLSDAYASTLTGGSTTASSYSSQARRTKRPPAAVMISYNHLEAKEYAIALHAALEAQGVSAYLDLYDIQKGDDWQDSLNFAILDCRVFVPLITPSYGETLWTSRECKLADVLAKRIVPVNFGQRWPPPSLAIQFATLQYIDWLHHELVSVLDPHMMADEGGPTTGWPRECVQAIARQLKARLQSDLLHAAVTAASLCYEDSGMGTSGAGSTQLQTAPPLGDGTQGGVATRKVHNHDNKSQQRRQQQRVNLSMPQRGVPLHLQSPLDTASTTAASSCHTTGSSSPSCYDSMAESSRSAATGYSPPGGSSPTLLDELADASNFVLVPTVSARVAAQTPPPSSPSREQHRKRSLGQRTKKVLTRLRSSLAVKSSAGA